MANAMSGRQIGEQKAKLGSGERFKALSGSVADEYKKKGVSTKKAEAIGAAVAAKQGRKKYGATKMRDLADDGHKPSLTAQGRAPKQRTPYE